MNQQTLPSLDLSEAIKLAWSKLTQFSGRSRRSEFWWAYLTFYVGAIVVSMVPIIGAVATLALELATIPLIFRRLHDTGRSGWWMGADIILSIAGATAFFVNLFSVMGEMFMGNEMDNMEPVEALMMVFQIFGNPVVLSLLIVSIIVKITILVFLCQDSNPEPNRYGDSPKYVF